MERIAIAWKPPIRAVPGTSGLVQILQHPVSGIYFDTSFQPYPTGWYKRSPEMLEWRNFCIVLALTMILVLVLPASGAIYTVPPGGTVFIGEQGLDINQTGATSNTMIGWFGPGNNFITGPPATTTSVDNAKNFYIAPSIFGGKTGPWYTLPGKQLAFYVEDPRMTLRILDDTSDFEITGMDTWVPKGDQVGFRIETNLVAIADRPGASTIPVTIHVRMPNGNELAAVSNYRLGDIPISTSPFSTGPVWDTGTYPSGTYEVWAVCNANSMKDNYPVEGKTETPIVANVRILATNPLITTSVSPGRTIIPGTSPAGPVVTAVVTTAATSGVQTTTVPTTTPLTPVPTTLPPATTSAQGPDIVLIVGILGLAALIVWGKDPS